MGESPLFSSKEVKVDEIQENIEATIAGALPDVEVILVEMAGSGGSSTVRVFIDREDGVDHGLCARVTEVLRDLLRDFRVEVSSPGVERPLTKAEHFQRQIGQRIKVQTSAPVDGRRNFRGELLGVEDGKITVACMDREFQIPQEAIRKSNLMRQSQGVRK